MLLSIIIPVYNRPNEVRELLASLPVSDDLEVIIVEDGSTVTCDPQDARYFFTENGGPGVARNCGAARAVGDYLIFLDSDCIVPPGWLAAVIEALPADAWGGPDRAAANFTPLQKAINYAMTATLTTGGIRGRAHAADRFYPRTFNMGVRRAVFEAVGGFAPMRYGEDIDLSYRIVEAGYQTKLVPAAWVYHKRRTRWGAFFRQVRHSGAARVELTRRHPGTLKLVHLMPAVFTVLCLTVVVPVIFGVIIFIDATLRTRSLRIGVLSIWASLIQLIGYGWGMMVNFRSSFAERT